ncbi:hypothetical protein R9D66_004258 [Citrobacter amalonaticus]|nr:hypothetical protein [Citrobacter amalonaticus]
MTGVLSIAFGSFAHLSFAQEIIAERHDARIIQMMSPDEGSRLQDIVAGRDGILMISGGLSATPCLADSLRQGDSMLRIVLSSCGEGRDHTGYLPVDIRWRNSDLQPWKPYPLRILPDGDSVFNLPVDRVQSLDLLHLMMSYE